ncbi:hypothetical protein LTS14_007138 [Recurvomyces mirabilis]|uniref:uncharacterized protein n=1 Tax=Recurvomyces mirabilis TaxID=574656 RepID=UPI002DDF3790|nr:hypothetical protein LTS14_007138 [Recurvomyces mirabilis]
MAPQRHHFEFDVPPPATHYPVDHDIILSASLRQTHLAPNEQHPSRPVSRHPPNMRRTSRKRHHEGARARASQVNSVDFGASLRAIDFGFRIKSPIVSDPPMSKPLPLADAALKHPWPRASDAGFRDASSTETVMPQRTFREVSSSIRQALRSITHPRGPPYYAATEWVPVYGFAKHLTYYAITAANDSRSLSFEELRMMVYQI